MPADPDIVIHRLVVADDTAVAEIVARAATSDDVTTVIAAALFSPSESPVLMTRAAALATTTRDRQLVEIANAHLDGDQRRVEDLARDHLTDHPDSVLAAWITSAGNHSTQPRKDPT